MIINVALHIIGFNVERLQMVREKLFVESGAGKQNDFDTSKTHKQNYM